MIGVHPLHTVNTIGHRLKMKPKKLRKVQPLAGCHPTQDVNGLGVNPNPLQLGVECAQGVCAPGSGQGFVVNAIGHGGDYVWAVKKWDDVLKRCLRWAAADMDHAAMELRRLAQ